MDASIVKLETASPLVTLQGNLPGRSREEGQPDCSNASMSAADAVDRSKPAAIGPSVLHANSEYGDGAVVRPLLPAFWPPPTPGLGLIKHDRQTGEPYFEPMPDHWASSVFGGATFPKAGSIAFLFGKVPHRQYLHGVDAVRGEITVLASPGGVGKSSWALAMAVSVSIGRKLLGATIFGPELKAIYINAEDSRTEMLRRVWALCIQHNISEHALTRLTLLGADDPQVQNLSLLRTEKGASVLDEGGLRAMETLLASTRADLVVLDPLIALSGGGNINDNAVMAQVMRAIKRMAASFNCAVLVIHHTRKGGDLASADAIGGAAAIVNLARRAIMLVSMNAEEAKLLGVLPSQRWRYLRVVSAKSNLSPPSSETEWYELRSVTLPNAAPPTYPNGDGVQAIVRAALPPQVTAQHGTNHPQVRQVIIDLVDGGKLIDGQAVPYSPNLSGAANVRGLLDDAIAAAGKAVGHVMAPEDLRAIVDREIRSLRQDGVLVDQEILSGRFRRGRGLSVDRERVTSTQEPIAAEPASAVEPAPAALPEAAE